MSQSKGRQAETRPIFGGIERRLPWPVLACACVVGALLAGLSFSATAHATGASVKAWGYNGEGELGNGTTSPAGCQCIASPVAVSGLSNAVAIAAGDYHGLALRSDGTVVAWGYNRFGQLGDGTTSPSSTPVPVSGLSHVVAVAAGSDYSLALLKGGMVVAWGYNEDGELGTGTSTATGCRCIKTPTPVSGLSHVVAIAGGHSGGLSGMALRSDGTVRDWGYNGDGELGTGTTDPTSVPAQVSGLSHVVAISAGHYNGLALLANGTVRDWGFNNQGELGNGTTTTTGCFCSDTPVAVSGLSHVVSIAGGAYHSEALLQTGGAKAWGENASGQLGNATPGDAHAPVAVSGFTDASAIAAGAYHGLALRSSRTVMAWGENDRGQLGNGTTTTTGCFCINSPVAVGGLARASAIAAGSNGSLALTGPRQTLRVTRAGAGAGAVGGAGIICPPACAHQYPQGSFAILRAVPTAGTRFAGFSGACRGGSACQVQMTGDRGVVATFGRPKGTKITRAKIKPKKGSASFSFGAPGAISGFQCKLVKPKATHHKRPKARFSSCSSPKRYKHLSAGKYTFEVRARDSVGVDAAPARRSFKI